MLQDSQHTWLFSVTDGDVSRSLSSCHVLDLWCCLPCLWSSPAFCTQLALVSIRFFIKLCNHYRASSDMPQIPRGRGHHSLWCGAGKVSASAARTLFFLFIVNLFNNTLSFINVCVKLVLCEGHSEDVWEQSTDERMLRPKNKEVSNNEKHYIMRIFMICTPSNIFKVIDMKSVTGGVCSTHGGNEDSLCSFGLKPQGRHFFT